MLFRYILTEDRISATMVSALPLSLLLLAGVCYANISPATIEDVPSVVQVESGYSIAWVTTCVGNVLTNVHILSAGRCFGGILASPNTRRIRAGATNRLCGGVILNVQSIAINEEGDLSVVRLTSSLTFGSTIQQGAITSHGTVIPPNMAVTTAGWGFIEKDGWRPVLGLRTVNLVTTSIEACRSKYDEFIITQVTQYFRINNNHLCSGLSEEGGLSTDPTDAGAPIYVNNVIVGIRSYGLPISNAYPVVSTSVGAFTNWIVAQAV